MICLITNCDYRTGISEALPVMYADFVDKNPGPFEYKVYADPRKAKLRPGFCYSFLPKDFTIQGNFVRGELDYEFFNNS